MPSERNKKTALGGSKYENVQQTIYEKRKEMKGKQYETSQKENGHNELNQLRENLAEKSCKERVSETILR